MEETIANIVDIRNRQRKAIKAALAQPTEETVKQILAIDRELCAALTDAINKYGSKAGVSGPITEASTAPKD